ncbi:MAG: TetR/AcrR family transcriptional regulator [Clostridiales bacterium]|nr:TetR/AcrR family transcriptional regulator [Clostridiales bacterium]
MPKATFFNLPSEKRELIISAATQVFSAERYNAASINQICRKAGIAKGSFYQYFDNKLDLYVYIMKSAIQAKVRFFSDAVDEFNNLSLSEQFKLLFVKGAEFAKAQPLYAALGEQFLIENDEAAKAAVIKEGDMQAQSLLITMIQNAKAKGEIDNGVDELALSILLQSVSDAVSKLGNMGSESSAEDINSLVDSLISIVYNGIRKRD